MAFVSVLLRVHTCLCRLVQVSVYACVDMYVSRGVYFCICVCVIVAACVCVVHGAQVMCDGVICGVTTLWLQCGECCMYGAVKRGLAAVDVCLM